MNAGRLRQLERIFDEARQLPMASRGEFLQRACGSDEALRREAEGLLVADDRAGQFLAEPAIERLAQSVASDGWTLQPGERIGAYTILRRLGAGGAGEVWRARDERLARDVAIKVLLPHFSGDPERLRRFADEAKTAGALNHSNILTVYDVGEHRGTPFLVSECLEGQSLRQRLAETPAPFEEAVTVTLGIARGLAAAHVRGIVHRDLKPENIFIRSDGVVKILDFGLAKLQSALEGFPAEPTNTMTGVIVGTAGYMAPEQVKGEAVDARTDLFAVGIVLYEMLAGRHPFRRASTFETLNAILTDEPRDLLALNDGVPAQVGRVAMRLLRKAPDARFQSAIDLAWALEQAALPGSSPEMSAAPAHRTVRLRQFRSAGWALASLLAAVVLVGAWWKPWEAPDRTPVPRLTQFTWTLPAGLALDSAPVVSPDGQHIAFVGKDATGSRLFVRTLAARDPVAIDGTEGGSQPFWAPDSRSLGFFAKGQLLKVRWPGGAPVAIGAAPQPRGATWSPDGVVTFAPDVILAGLSRVSADGGKPEPATLLDVAHGDTSHWWPVFLPDGKHFLYSVRSADDQRVGIYLGGDSQPRSPAGVPLVRSTSVGAAPLRGSKDVALFYAVNGRIEVCRLDTTRLTVGRDARTIGLTADGGTLYHPIMLSASADVLAFAETGVPSGNRLASVVRDGQGLRLWNEPEALNWPRVSPDGRYLAIQRVDALRNNPDIWIEDLQRATKVRVTTAPEPDIQPVWSPDGRYVAFVSGSLPGRAGRRMLSIAAADGTGVLRAFPCPSGYCEPTDWSPDGNFLLVNMLDTHGRDVWKISAQQGIGAPVLADGFPEYDARFSPDGRWIAYVSEESGRPEVSARSITGPPQRVVLSGGGGNQPVWRRSELFLVDPIGRLRRVAARRTSSGAWTFGLPAALDVPPIGAGHWGTQYDVSPDGQRIYFLKPNEDPPPRDIHVVIGWRSLLEGPS